MIQLVKRFHCDVQFTLFRSADGISVKRSSIGLKNTHWLASDSAFDLTSESAPELTSLAGVSASLVSNFSILWPPEIRWVTMNERFSIKRLGQLKQWSLRLWGSTSLRGDHWVVVTTSESANHILMHWQSVVSTGEWVLSTEYWVQRRAPKSDNRVDGSHALLCSQSHTLSTPVD